MPTQEKIRMGFDLIISPLDYPKISALLPFGGRALIFGTFLFLLPFGGNQKRCFV